MRNKKHNPKIPILIGVALFLGISIAVINAKDMQTISRVKFSNQKIVINQGDTGFSNTDVGLNNSGNFKNQNIDGSNTDLNIGNNGNFSNTGSLINNNGRFGNQNTDYGNNGQFNNAGGSINNSGNFGNQNTGYGNHGGFNNTGGSVNNNGNFGSQNNGFGNHGNNIGNKNNSFQNNNENNGNYNVGFGNKDYRSDMDKFKYQDIDWSTWKSNFVNRILDDSMYITSLDFYGLGTWFYYSFNVTDKGEIKDVFVFSLYLNENDKRQVRELIRSYAHKPITIFPKDSQRKKAKVKAIMLLGDTETKSNASNFNDIEKIKIKY